MVKLLRMLAEVLRAMRDVAYVEGYGDGVAHQKEEK